MEATIYGGGAIASDASDSDCGAESSQRNEGASLDTHCGLQEEAGAQGLDDVFLISVLPTEAQHDLGVALQVGELDVRTAVLIARFFLLGGFELHYREHTRPLRGDDPLFVLVLGQVVHRQFGFDLGRRKPCQEAKPMRASSKRAIASL